MIAAGLLSLLALVAQEGPAHPRDLPIPTLAPYSPERPQRIELECGATLLHIHLHHFTPNGGVSGVAVLAESHISIHTWPERGYAALDVFMCGAAEPQRSVDVLRAAFQPKRLVVGEHLRGRGA